MKRNRIAGIALIVVLALLAVQYREIQKAIAPVSIEGDAEEEYKNRGDGEAVTGNPRLQKVTLNDKSVVSRGIQLTLLHQESSKELGEDIDTEEIYYFSEPHDENGVLEDGYQYVFVEIEVENTNDEVAEFYLNSILLSHVDEEGFWFGMVAEMSYRSDVGIDPRKKDRFRVELEPGAKKQVTVGWIVEEEYMKPDFDSRRIS